MDPNKRSERGVIAQQVEQVMPHAVSHVEVEKSEMLPGIQRVACRCMRDADSSRWQTSGCES
jgi:hypothetical protein